VRPWSQNPNTYLFALLFLSMASSARVNCAQRKPKTTQSVGTGWQTVKINVKFNQINLLKSKLANNNLSQCMVKWMFLMALTSKCAYICLAYPLFQWMQRSLTGKSWLPFASQTHWTFLNKLCQGISHSRPKVLYLQTHDCFHNTAIWCRNQ
jgi:hypothetical protein